METKDPLSSRSDYDGKEIEQMQQQAQILKESYMNSVKDLGTTIRRLTRKDFHDCYLFKRAFPQLLGDSTTTLDSSNMSNDGSEADQDEQKFEKDRDLLA
ncbi:hypothetical protein Tco_0169250 [Tanacetum coccineum]